MSLSHDMWNRLQQAAYEAEQAQRSSPRGLIPMSKEQGQQILNNLRTTPYHNQQRPHIPIRPMTMEQGAQILYRLTSPPPTPNGHIPPTSPLIRTFLQRFLR